MISIRKYYSYNDNALSDEYDWCYSAKELQEKLRSLFLMKTINGIYVDAYEFLEGNNCLSHNNDDITSSRFRKK